MSIEYDPEERGHRRIHCRACGYKGWSDDSGACPRLYCDSTLTTPDPRGGRMEQTIILDGSTYSIRVNHIRRQNWFGISCCYGHPITSHLWRNTNLGGSAGSDFAARLARRDFRCGDCEKEGRRRIG